MIKLIKQGAEISSAKLNEIITAVNASEALYNRIVAATNQSDIKKAALEAVVENFVSQYGSIIQDTPDIIDMLEQYLALAEAQISFTDGPSHLEVE